MRKIFPINFKSKVVLRKLKEDLTMAELSSKFEIHRCLIQRWKSEAIEGLPELFSDKFSKNKKKDEELISELYKQIGQLKVENDWLKKKVETVNA